MHLGRFFKNLSTQEMLLDLFSTGYSLFLLAQTGVKEGRAQKERWA